MNLTLLRLLLICVTLTAPQTAQTTAAEPVRILVDQAPLTLNPRMAMDATSQRINALIFRALTKIDKDLEPRADLAKGWKIRKAGRLWEFEVRDGVTDHGGSPITPGKIAACLENYRTGKPLSPLAAAFPHWKGTRATKGTIAIELEKPDPYLARNISSLRFFTSGKDHPPCSESIANTPLVGSGPFKPAHWNMHPQTKLLLLPADGPGGYPGGYEDRLPVRFLFVPDENAKAMKLLRGEVDIAQNAFSLSKTDWFKRAHADQFDVIERDGVSVSYLAFNLRDPLLSRKEVRHAIAASINRGEITAHKFFGFASPAGSILSPLLPESFQAEFRYDPVWARSQLDDAGLLPGKNGVRFMLHYKTTTQRMGIETALIIKDMLRQVGIELIVDVVEPAVFFSSIRKGHFQLCGPRWIGIADGSILHRTLRSGKLDNRVAYSNPKVDHLLDRAISEPDLEKRKQLLRELQMLVAEDLPYFPLWYWNNAVVSRKGLHGLTAEDISLSGAFEPLTRVTREHR